MTSCAQRRSADPRHAGAAPALRTRAAVAVAALAALTLPAGAAIPAADGLVHACYATKDGALRVIDPSAGQGCDAKKELPLAWSQRGPAGPTGATGPGGPPGPAGAQGPQGAAGPSHAYANYGAPSQQRIANGTTQTVASVTLPAGSYTLAATVFGSGVGGARNLSCYFVSAGTLHGRPALLQIGDIASAKQPLIGEATVAADNTSVFLRCSALDGDFDVLGEMIATRIQTIAPSL